MIELPYSVVIEATEETDYFGFLSPELEGFPGIAHSVKGYIYKAKQAMSEHVNLFKKQGLPIPLTKSNPKTVIRNERASKAA